MAKAIPTPPYTHILPALVLLRKPLYGLANISYLERYTTFTLNLVENNLKRLRRKWIE